MESNCIVILLWFWFFFYHFTLIPNIVSIVKIKTYSLPRNVFPLQGDFHFSCVTLPVRLLFSVKQFAFLEREVHLLSEQHFQMRAIYSFSVQLHCGIWDCFKKVAGCEMCEDSMWKRREWPSRLVPQNYTLTEVQLNQNPHLKGKYILDLELESIWFPFSNFVLASGILTRLSSWWAKPMKGEMINCLGNIKLWWQELFFFESWSKMNPKEVVY